MKMSYKSTWYTKDQLAYIARELRNKEGAPRRCYGTLLADRGSDGRRLAGGYGQNVEEKAVQLGFNRGDVRRALDIARL